MPIFLRVSQFPNRTHCRRMMRRNVKVPMNVYIAPRFQRRGLLSTGHHYYLVPLLLQSEGQRLRKPPGAGLPQKVFLGRFSPALTLGLCGVTMSQGKSQKRVTLHPPGQSGHQSHLLLGTSEWISLGSLAFLSNAGTRGRYHGPWF